MKLLEDLFSLLGSASVTVALIGLIYQMLRDVWRSYPHYKLSIIASLVTDRRGKEPIKTDEIIIRNIGNRSIFLDTIGYVTKKKTDNLFYTGNRKSMTQMNVVLKPNELKKIILEEPDTEIASIIIVDAERRIYKTNKIYKRISRRQLNKVRSIW